MFAVAQKKYLPPASSHLLDTYTSTTVKELNFTICVASKTSRNLNICPITSSWSIVLEMESWPGRIFRQVYQSSSERDPVGEIVIEHPSKLGKATAMRQNPYNAIVHTGYSNGTSPLLIGGWSRSGRPLVTQYYQATGSNVMSPGSCYLCVCWLYGSIHGHHRHGQQDECIDLSGTRRSPRSGIWEPTSSSPPTTRPLLVWILTPSWSLASSLDISQKGLVSVGMRSGVHVCCLYRWLCIRFGRMCLCRNRRDSIWESITSVWGMISVCID